jgi:class 3 adenylate cyclase/tetratricopeptide (TPR) repeat protein
MATSYTLGPFHLDVETRILFRGAEPLALGQRAVALLCALVERHGKPVPKDALIEAAWAGLTVEEGNLAVQIAALRRVLGEVPGGERWIETLPRRGYRFVGPVIIRKQDATVASPVVAGAPDRTPTAVRVAAGDLEHKSDTASRSGPREEATPSTPVHPGSPERRQLTIMVCTIVGSMPLATALDPEDMSDRIAAFHKAVTGVAAQFGGFVAQYLGDGVHIYFGYPAASEHDAEQAVRAGLTIVDTVGMLNASSGEPLQARVGLATGLVVVGEQVGTGNTRQRVAIGESPNLAAQLQAVAAPGAVVIAASTRRLVGQMFECRALGASELKGLPRLIEAWQVRGETAGVSRFDARRTGTLSPLVGRQEEMELMLRRWGQAKLGEGRVVLLSGEPGIGKSRIAESLLHSLEGEPHTRFRYFCSPHHAHSALYPFISQLEGAASFESGSSVSAKFDKLAALLKVSATNRSRDVALIAELLGVPTDARYPALAVSPQQKREMTFTALLGQLDGVAAQNPVLIVFEDAHWIDPTSLDLLDRMVVRAANLPLLLVVTVRPEVQPTWVGQPHVTMLHLNRLSRRDSAGIINGVTKSKALPDAVVEQVLAHTDGVPLFIEELTSTLLESRLLRETQDRYVLDRPLPPLAIPTTLQASLVARLDRLASVKDVAQIGAAIGRDFSYELIASVSGLPPKDLDAALERLAASGLISRRGAPPDATYSFKHALIQDAAYDTMLKSQRRQLHASIAKVLVERFPAMTESLPEVVAHHYAEAGVATEAVGYWRRAGQIATARSANREAVNFFEKALSALDELSESQNVLEQGFEVRLELRRVLIQVGEVRRVLEQVREAETLAEKLNDDHRRGRACAFMTNVHGQLGELDEPLVWSRRALAIARTLGSLELQILTTTFLEMVHYYRGDYQRVVDLAIANLASVPAEQVYAHFGATGPAAVFDRHCLVMSLAQLGRFLEAAEHEAEAIRLAESTNHAFTVALAYFPSHTHQILKADWATARTRLERLIAVLRADDLVLLLPTSVACSAWVLAQLGETDEALSRLRESERLLEREVSTGFVPYHGWAFHALGRACLLLDRLDEAQIRARRALEASSRQPGFAAHALHLLGDIATHLDRFNPQTGEVSYRKALVLAEPLGMTPLVAHCHLGLGKLYRRTGKRTRAQKHVTTATAIYRDTGMTYWLEQAEAEMRQLQ